VSQLAGHGADRAALSFHSGIPGALFPDNEAAVSYGRQIMNELRKNQGPDEPISKLIIKDSAGEIASIY